MIRKIIGFILMALPTAFLIYLIGAAAVVVVSSLL